MKKIDDLLGVARNRIQRVGIELEGGWKKLPKGQDRLEHDGSVQFPVEILRDRITGGMLVQTGEIPSPPLEVKEIEKWLFHHYPSHVNATCGMHVHVSFRSSMLYQRLMVPELTEDTVRLVTTWAKSEKLPLDHPLWSRLEGKSNYCQKRFDAALQSKVTTKGHNQGVRGNRYTMWNYCYGFHSTLECRLLPMMETKEQALRAISLILNIVNASLACRPKREIPVEATIIADESSFIEDSINVSF